MTRDNVQGNGRITALYQRLVRLYSEAPYRFARSGRALPAWHYYIELTRRCNLRCQMCQYIDWLQTTPTKVQAEGELTTAEWKGVIDQMGRFSLVTFTGGEIFVRKDFMEIFEYACARLRVHFISNATMLTEERAKRCAELAPKRFGGRGFNFAGTSIDGTADVHDEVRAQRGAFEKSTRGMRALTEHRLALGKKAPLMHINTVIMEKNLECLPDLPHVAKSVGADVLNLLTEMRSHDIPELGHTDPSAFGREDITMRHIDRALLDRQLSRTMAEAKKLGIEVRLPRMPYAEVLNHYDGGYDLRKFECRSIWTNCYIGAKGGVYPCFIKKIGNVREHSLKEIWNNAAARDFRVRRRDGGFAVCRGCCEIEYSDKFAAAIAQHEPADTSDDREKQALGA